MVSARLKFQELVRQPVTPTVRQGLITAARELKGTLRARDLMQVEGESVRFLNLIGSFRLPTGEIVEVAPKTDHVGDWASAVVQLLEPGTRLAVTGSQRSRATQERNSLASMIAVEYARRLEGALRLDGPLHVYERRSVVSRRLNGRLDTTRWVRSSVLDPTIFPVTRDELSFNNAYTRAMSKVAGILSRAASSGELASRLRRLQTGVIPGHPAPSHVDPAAAFRKLPAQWARYAPAWDIASALLRHLNVVGDPGRINGLEVAVEPWLLLETALSRALQALERTSDYHIVPKARFPILTEGGHPARGVVPDGMLHRDGAVAATFECKYTQLNGHPERAHVYQTLATAVAVRSPVAVLIYPGDSPARRYDTVGFNETPGQLITLGLDLFQYRRGSGDDLRAKLIEHQITFPSAGPSNFDGKGLDPPTISTS